MDVREKIALLPHSPGVYRYYNADGEVIYVGKAKDLHKRVAQYFVPPERLNTKTRILVSKIADLQYSVVDSEADALLLENNLIKQYKPRYNILLKDSKTYPWICVTSEPYPRVFLTRRVEKNGSRYFGPYSTVMHARYPMGMGRVLLLLACDINDEVCDILADELDNPDRMIRVIELLNTYRESVELLPSKIEKKTGKKSEQKQQASDFEPLPSYKVSTTLATKYERQGTYNCWACTGAAFGVCL